MIVDTPETNEIDLINYKTRKYRGEDEGITINKIDTKKPIDDYFEKKLNDALEKMGLDNIGAPLLTSPTIPPPPDGFSIEPINLTTWKWHDSSIRLWYGDSIILPTQQPLPEWQFHNTLFAPIENQNFYAGHLMPSVLLPTRPEYRGLIGYEALVPFEKPKYYIEPIDQEKFESYQKQWRRETIIFSNPKTVMSNENFLKILLIGRDKLIPILLNELKKDDSSSHLFSVLVLCIGFDPTTEADRTDHDRLKNAWIKWGIENNYIND